MNRDKMAMGNIQIPVRTGSQNAPQNTDAMAVIRPGESLTASEAQILAAFRRKLAERERAGMAVSTPVLTASERMQALNPAPGPAASWAETLTVQARQNPLHAIAAIAGIAAALKYIFSSPPQRG